jgi:hypothetical protein
MPDMRGQASAMFRIPVHDVLDRDAPATFSARLVIVTVAMSRSMMRREGARRGFQRPMRRRKRLLPSYDREYANHAAIAVPAKPRRKR